MGDATPTTTVAGGGSQALNDYVMVSFHAYYLHPSYAPGMVLVSAPFDCKGFEGWRRAMLIALLAKNKIGFIDGNLPKPASAPLLNAWTRCNDTILSWLLNSLSKDIAESVLYSHSDQYLWEDLEARYGQTNGQTLLTTKEIIRFSSRKDKTNKAQEDEWLLQFLMGLNDSYLGVRRNIFMNNPLPSIGHAYSFVIQDEK
ncbi:uncharacterized protein LOC125847017 [Solanum stenotomum]|uniref:uncharacterized protein LOC125847017 n=1 Tax=Solanum stenotomum TaxID=172797 RepID=UPI0020D07279|nr:uncharacterized protein LOC125847017 [Solanum stenotomum]